MSKSSSKAGVKNLSKRKVVTKYLSVGLTISLIAAPSILNAKLGIGVSPILSGSMRPYATPGDAFITRDLPASTLKVGDIIAVHSKVSGTAYAHRITQISAQSGLLRIVTKGDANPTSEVDPFMISPNKLVSKNIARVKYIGYILVYVTSMHGRQLASSLLVFANVLVLIMFIFRKKIKTLIPNAERIFRELYSESQEVKTIKERELLIYKDLYAESELARKKQVSDITVFRDLFDEAQEVKEIREEELIEMLEEVKSLTNLKENTSV
jgi:signal peptidase I